MKTITIVVSNDKYRTWQYFLRRKYKSKRMSLKNLIRMAAILAVHEQAEKETRQ